MMAKYVSGLPMQNLPPLFLGVWFLAKPGIFHLPYSMVGRHFIRSSETNLTENGQRYRQSYGSLTIPFLFHLENFYPVTGVQMERMAALAHGWSCSWLSGKVERLEERNLGSLLLHSLCRHIFV